MYFVHSVKKKEKIPHMYKVNPVNLLNPNDVVLCKNMYKMPNIMASELPSFNDSELPSLNDLEVKIISCKPSKWKI